MRKTILAFFSLLAGAVNAFGQSTTVSGQVTDAGGQSWNNGTFTATFVPNPQYPTGPYTWTGGTLNTAISGTLSGTGGYSVSLPSNSAISPVGSQWQIQFVPNATSAPFLTANTTITGATQTLNATPPDISINLQNPPGPFTTAYADDEIATPIPQGAEYFNTTSLLTRVWNGSAWANQGTGGGGGGTVTGTGVANQVAFWTAASAIGGNTALTFDPATGSLTAASASGTQLIQSIAGQAKIVSGPTQLNSLIVAPSFTQLQGHEVGSSLLFVGDAAISFTVGTAQKFSLPTATGAAGQVLSTNGASPQVTSWITPNAGTVTGSGAATRLAIWNGASSLTSNANLTYDANGTLTSIGSALATSGIAAGNNQIQINGLSAGNTIGLLAGETGATIVLQSKNLNASSANGELDIGANVASFGGVLGLLGSTSGTAKIQVAAAAGTPNPLQLPTTTGTSGQVLSTNGANPQVLSWIAAGGTGTVTNVATTSPITGGPITTTGTIACATCVTSAAALTSNQLMTGAGSQASQTLGTLGTTTTVLHGNAGGAPTFGAVSLTTDVSGTLPVGSGGTGLASGTSGGILGFTGSTTLASSAALAVNGPVIGGGAGATPTAVTPPTTPNGVPQYFIETPSGGVATAETFALAGVPVDATNPATLLVTDRANYLPWTSGSALALPAVTTSFASNFPFVLKNTSGGTLTITPNAGASDLIDGAATATVLNNFSSFVYQDSTTAPGHWFTIKHPTFAAFPACADTTGNHLNFTTVAGFSCGTSVTAATTQTIANGTSALGTGAISSATCATVVTTSATGTATTDNIQADFNADPTSTTGYSPSASGMLTIIKYPTTNNVNFKVCNNTSGSITPGAVTLNWRVVR